jgi:acetolactate synthase small subunit
MTVGAWGNPEGLDQIIQQVSKRIDVLKCADHTGDDAVIKEFVLVKIEADSAASSEALQVGQHFG